MAASSICRLRNAGISVDAGIHFGRIHLIEWLRPDDLKTGRALFDELQPLGIVAKPSVDTVFHSIATRAELVAVLRAVEGQFRADGVIPLLHIETHGNKEGIGISHDEGLDFIDLARELMPLNERTALRLFVVLGACESLWGMTMSMPSERAAFQVILGSIREVTGGEMAAAMQAFYRSAFADRNGDQAITAMNAAVDLVTPTFGAFSAAMGFKMVYQEWIARSLTPEAIDRTVEDMNAEQGAFLLALYGTERSDEQVEADRIRIRAELENHEATFQEFRTRYFMIDLFPENDMRFPLTFADMQKDGPT